jgi:uncharacterized membrane protein YhaH (DUF805 family)
MAVCVNRCHDNDVSASWFALLALTPLWLTLVMTLFSSLCAVLDGCYCRTWNLLVSLEVKMETYRHSTGEQFKVILK